MEHNPRNNMPVLQKSLAITRLSKSVLQNRTWILEFIIIFLSVASRAPADGGPAPRTPLQAVEKLAIGFSFHVNLKGIT